MRVKLPAKKLSLIIAGVLVLMAAGLIIALMHKPKATSGQIKVIHTSNTSKPTPAVTPQSSSAEPSEDSQSTEQVKTSSPGNQSSTPADLVAPYGSLVSNHRPGQNGSNLVESSQCTTSAGAKCYLKFTQGDVVKTLPEKQVDSSGSVTWDWNVKDAGLTSGDWTITAVATAGDQVKTTKDQMVLEVQ